MFKWVLIVHLIYKYSQVHNTKTIYLVQKTSIFWEGKVQFQMILASQQMFQFTQKSA